MKESLLEKHQFMQQYVLNRAIGHSGGLGGAVCAKEAAEAWEYIIKECNK